MEEIGEEDIEQQALEIFTQPEVEQKLIEERQKLTQAFDDTVDRLLKRLSVQRRDSTAELCELGLADLLGIECPAPSPLPDKKHIATLRRAARTEIAEAIQQSQKKTVEILVDYYLKNIQPQEKVEANFEPKFGEHPAPRSPAVASPAASCDSLQTALTFSFLPGIPEPGDDRELEHVNDESFEFVPGSPAPTEDTLMTAITYESMVSSLEDIPDRVPSPHCAEISLLEAMGFGPDREMLESVLVTCNGNVNQAVLTLTGENKI